MRLINFAHPLTPKHLEQVVALTGQPIDHLQEIKSQFELEQPLAPQIIQLLDALTITPDEWQSVGWLIVLPSLNYAAAVLLAELHGRMGHFPSILRLRPVTGMLVTEYEIAEIVNLEAVRSTARMRR